MNLKDLVVVTSNKNKLKEINAILGTSHRVSKINVPEIQSLDVDEVITEKAKAAFLKIKKPVVVTDVTLEIEALGGLPGPFVKFFLHTLGAEGTAKLLKGKSTKAKVTDAIAIYDGRDLKIFKGTVYGKLIDKAKGTNGFGFDVVFVPRGYKKTYAQLSNKEKNEISHRAKALKKLKEYL